MADRSTARLVARLLGLAAAMFLFAVFVMPPLYDVFCEVTGIGGKTGGAARVRDAGVDQSRTIEVQFVATNNGAMPWEFGPRQVELRVHPGEPTRALYYARNPTDRPMVAQAIPSVTPASAARYFNKTECFCFNRQPLGPGEEAELPLVFVVDPELPSAIRTITLSYTLFDVTERSPDLVAKVAAGAAAR
ncbi:MAG: cytochrome c oxidase assembly protein [Porticoccaceae bacterium]|nr:MAG: cytochrome c oxidase assembly protein [Porticoccaceae bacterium]